MNRYERAILDAWEAWHDGALDDYWQAEADEASTLVADYLPND